MVLILKKGEQYQMLGCVSLLSASSAHAEFIALVTSIGFALHPQAVWKNSVGVVLPKTVVTDRLGLHKILSTQATPTDMKIAAGLHSLLIDNDIGIIDSVSWVEGKKNPVDPLTKPLAGEIAGIL